MIKRRLSISFVTWAVSVLMILAVLPHHHHGDLACILVERCNQDGSLNDIHTEHHDDEDGRHTDEGECFLSSSRYVVVNQHFSFGQRCLGFDVAADAILSVILRSAMLFETSGESCLFANYHLYYKSALLNSSNSFRAPPVA